MFVGIAGDSGEEMEGEGGKGRVRAEMVTKSVGSWPEWGGKFSRAAPTYNSSPLRPIFGDFSAHSAVIGPSRPITALGVRCAFDRPIEALGLEVTAVLVDC